MPITHLLLDNHELGKISKEQRAVEMDVWQTSLHNPDFAAYAELCGALGIHVDHRDQLDEALSRALAHPGPSLVAVTADSRPALTIAGGIARPSGAGSAVGEQGRDVGLDHLAQGVRGRTRHEAQALRALAARGTAAKARIAASSDTVAVPSTAATTRSPHSGSGRPTTAASWTAGWSRNTSSTSRG